MASFIYITLLSIFIILPTIIVILKNRKFLSKYKLVIFSSLIVFPTSMLWDYIATKNSIWYFVNFLDIWVLGLPIEEIIFMISLILFVSSITLIILKKR